MTFPLPHDLLQNYFLPRYFLDNLTLEDLDEKPVPSMLLVLQLVSKQFYEALKKCDRAWKIIQNFHDLSRVEKIRRSAHFMSKACRDFGSVVFIQWLMDKFRLPMSPKYLRSAAEGVFDQHRQIQAELFLRRAHFFDRMA